jgi:uncharacterized protein (TIGR03437 family)
VIAVDYIDYPGDGRLAIVTFLDGSLSPVFSSVDIPQDSGDGLEYVSVTASDIDGDGRPDLLLSDPRGGLLVMTGGGDGTFHAPAGYPAASPSPNIFTGATTAGSHDDYWGSIATADFRNTGKQDIAMALAGKGVSLLKNGAGSPPAVNSLVNSATLTAGPAVAGSLTTIFGSGLAYNSGAGAANGAPDTLFGLTVQGNGTDAPLIYASPTQTNIQVPWELAGQPQATFLVTRNGATTTLTVPLATYAPGMFAMNSQGTGQAAAIIVATPPAIAAPAGAFAGSRPIRHGEYLELFGTGLGPVNCCEQTGQPGYSYNTTATLPIVTVGGQTATVQYSGAAPGLLGAYQVNILIPDSAPLGSAVPIQLSIGGVASNTVTIAIQ